MKKILVVLVTLVGFGMNCLGQTVIVQKNEVDKSKTEEECAYKINGICTTEDIGGVEVAVSDKTELNSGGGAENYLVFENYNNFVVSVIFELVSDARSVNERKLTGTIVLKPNEKKLTQNTYKHPSNFVLIVRKLKN